MMESTPRNTPQPLDLNIVEAIEVDTASIQQRANLYRGNPKMTKEQKVERLLLALRCMDLTSLSGEDNVDKIQHLAALAQQPLPEEPSIQVGAVCLYPEFITTAKEVLKDSSISIASVAAGFPTGLLPLEWRVHEIKAAIKLGAQEIDIVAPRYYSLAQDWEGLYNDLLALKKACGNALLKVILETGHLPNLEVVAKASQVALLAGADFIKTSTGKEAVGATLEAGIVMAQQLKDYQANTGIQVGLKPAGGIRRAQHAWQWLMLVEKELGKAWETPQYFRIGASSLLNTIQTQYRLLTS